MWRKILILGAALMGVWCCEAQQVKPVAVIFDTDMGPDYDDVGALTILHALEDKGEAKILATMACTDYEGVGSVINLLNTYFKKPNIPIGISKGTNFVLKDERHWTDSILRKYPHTPIPNKDAQDAVTLYRKILSQQPDNSVTIITVGFLTNMGNLLKSQADEHSKLNGIDLVRKKVKSLVSMAGRFPEGSEYNINQYPASAKYAFDNFPVPVIMSGFEIGVKVLSGLPLINNKLIKNSPVKDVYRICINARDEDKAGRMSWDQTAVLAAIRGHEPWYTLQAGRITIDEQGRNTWNKPGTGHYHLVEKMSSTEVTKIVNDLMMHVPAGTRN
jgi:pyrimidine-specific ribonucleoside hydrolase